MPFRVGFDVTLLTIDQGVLEVDAILNGGDFQDAFTRAKFEQLCADIFKEAASRGDNMWRQRAVGGGEWERVDAVTTVAPGPASTVGATKVCGSSV